MSDTENTQRSGPPHSETSISLKAHFEAILAEIEKRNVQRFESQSLATAAALAAADRAVTKAETSAEKRFEAVNEFRNTLGDQQRTLMPRSESEIRFSSLTDRVAKIELLLQERLGEAQGHKNGLAIILGLTTFVSTLIAIVFAFTRALGKG